MIAHHIKVFLEQLNNKNLLMTTLATFIVNNFKILKKFEVRM